jgi:oxygen-dependent protoporphyrinogen oxidase
VVVIGAGIAGLGAARELVRRGARVTVLERGSEVGGRCRSFEWHGRWHHTGAEALMSCESAMTRLRDELDRAGAAPTRTLSDWDTVHGERIWHDGRVLDLDPFSPTSLLRLPGGLRDKISLLRLVPHLLRQRRHHDPEDFTTAAPFDRVDGATYLRRAAPRLFDEVIEPFMQYSTLGSGDYGLAWLLWCVADIGWFRDGWWVYAERGAGGVTHELARQLQDQPGCQLLLQTPVKSIERVGGRFAVRTDSSGTVDSDAVVVAVPGSVAAGLVPDVVGPEHQNFLGGLDYASHHLARFLVDAAPPGLPRKVLLPSAAGFGCVGKITLLTEGGPPTVTVDIKDTYIRARARATDEETMDDAWSEVLRALPPLRAARVTDRVLTRNQIALCRRPAGFARNLAAFRGLPASPGIAFAGDYLINSTVGMSYLTGLQAAAVVAA